MSTGIFILLVLSLVGAAGIVLAGVYFEKETKITNVARQHTSAKLTFKRGKYSDWFAEVDEKCYLLKQTVPYDGIGEAYDVYNDEGTRMDSAFSMWLIREMKRAREIQHTKWLKAEIATRIRTQDETR